MLKKTKPDTWDLLSMMRNPVQDTRRIASLGQQALAMGIVSPEEAMSEVQQISQDVQRGPQLAVDMPGAIPGVSMNTDQASALLNERRAASQANAEMAPSIPSSTPGVFNKLQMPNLPEITMKPVPRGSGLQETDEATEKLGGKTNVQRMLTMTPEEWQSSYEAAMQTPAIQEQMRGIEDIRDLLRMEAAAPSQLDLGPLAALTDSLTGSRLQTGYARPEDRRKRLTDYMLKLQDDRKEMAKAIIDAIGKQKAGMFQEMLTQDFFSRRAAEAKDPNALVKPISPNALMAEGSLCAFWKRCSISRRRNDSSRRSG